MVRVLRFELKASWTPWSSDSGQTLKNIHQLSHIRPLSGTFFRLNLSGFPESMVRTVVTIFAFIQPRVWGCLLSILNQIRKDVYYEYYILRHASPCSYCPRLEQVPEHLQSRSIPTPELKRFPHIEGRAMIQTCFQRCPFEVDGRTHRLRQD